MSIVWVRPPVGTLRQVVMVSGKGRKQRVALRDDPS